MSDERNKTSTLVYQRYLVAVSEERVIGALQQLEDSLPEVLRELSNSLVHNVRALVASATIPFHLASSAVGSERFQQLHIAERLRAKAECERSGEETEGFLSPEAELRAYERAGEKLKAELEGSELVEKLWRYLLDAYETEAFAIGARELLRQASILTWGMFEVLARDLLRVYLNGRPRAAVDLARDPTAKGHFNFKDIDIETIAEFGFDLSTKMGEVVTSANDLSKIESIRAVYRALVGEHEGVASTLSDGRLWKLCQTRHLMVHRRGIADPRFVRATGSDLAVGDPVYVTPDELESYIEAVVRAGAAMLSAVAALFNSDAA